MLKYPQSAGGYAKANKIRSEYIKNPNKCRQCGLSILPRNTNKGELSRTKLKVFCNRSCAAKFNNSKRVKTNHSVASHKEIKTLWYIKLFTKTKKEVFHVCSSWQSARAAIQKGARFVYFQSTKDKECRNCGYDKHIDVCHIKAVKDFSSEDYVYSINAVSNLIGLCKNCHWELDNGILTI